MENCKCRNCPEFKMNTVRWCEQIIVFCQCHRNNEDYTGSRNFGVGISLEKVERFIDETVGSFEEKMRKDVLDGCCTSTMKKEAVK